MFPGWLAAVIACVLAAALAIVAMPSPPDEPVEAATIDETQVAIDHVRDTGTAARPEWRAGDAWRVQFNDGDPVCWMVVAEAGEAYRQGIACETDETEAIAVNLAVVNEPWYGGFTRDLAGIGNGEDDPTRWFSWPLTHGKSWDTSFEGVDVVVRAELVEGSFELAMTVEDDDEPFVRYDYDPALRWWSSLRFESGFVLLVHERATGWSGPVTLATAELQFDATSNFAASFTDSFTATEEDSYVALAMSRPTVGADYWELAAPSQTYNSLSPGVGVAQLLLSGTDRYELFAAEPGEWNYRHAGSGFGGFRAILFLAQVVQLDL